jgi:radical SAM-linked protein
MHALLRAVRRAGLPVVYSQGYHPKPRVSFGPALPVGVESLCEHLDLELMGMLDAADVAARLGRELPEAFRVMEARRVEPGEPSVSEALRAVHYRAEFPPDSWGEAALAERVAAFQGKDRAVVTRVTPPKGHRGKRQQKIADRGGREIDLKEIVTHLAVEGPVTVAFSLRADPSGSAKPAEVLAAIFGDGTPPRGVKLLKEGVSFAKTARPQSQGQPRAPRYLDA